MKRVLILLAALSAFVYCFFFWVAVPSSYGWETVMQDVSLGTGLLFAGLLLGLHSSLSARGNAAMFATMLFFPMIHPALAYLPVWAWLLGIFVSSVMIAAILEPKDRRSEASYSWHVIAAFFGLFSATFGPRCFYVLLEDTPLGVLTVIAVFQLLLFAFAAFAAYCAAKAGRSRPGLGSAEAR